MAKKAQTYSLRPNTPGASKSVAAYDPNKSKTYGRRWQAIRASFLAKHPLCVHCLQLNLTTPATQVDHILRLKWGGTHCESNLQALCASCHSRKTQQEARP